jgi:hypothetical protein
LRDTIPLTVVRSASASASASAYRRKFRIVAIAALSIAAACSLFNPLDDYGPPKAKSNEAGNTPDGGDNGETGGGTCVKAKWPPRPGADNGGADLGDVIFALETISIGGSADAGSIATAGYDLDNSCTCPDKPSCLPAPDAGPSVLCDLDGGIDSNGTILLEGFIRLGNLEVDTFKRVREGKKGLLFRIRHWNGGADDTKVELAVFLTSGTEKDTTTNDNKVPLRDGTDKWSLDPDSLVGGGPTEPGQPLIPNFVDTNAYVTSGVLVANIDFPLSFSDLILDLTGSVLTAKVTRRDGIYHLDDGRLVGRWATRKLLTVLDTVKDPYVAGAGLCGDSGLYRDLKKRICGGVDVVADPTRDHTDVACDALSITSTFSAGQAQFGPIVPKEPGDHFCGAGYSDDCSR